MINIKRRNRKLLRDCTSRIKKQKATLSLEFLKLKKEKELFEKLYEQCVNFYDSAPSGYMTLDRNGRISYANQSTGSFFKIDPYLLQGKYLIDFVDNYSKKTYTDFLEEMIYSADKKSCYLSVKFANAIPFDIEFEGIFLKGRNEFLINLVDISGRIKILHQFSEYEKKYQDILYNLNEGIAIVDLNESFIYSNKSGDEIFGVPDRGLMSHNLNEFLSPSQINIVLEQSKKRDGGIKSKYDLEIVTPEGKQKSLLVSSGPYLNRKEERIGTLASFSDITKQKINETEVRRRLKLELIISEISNDFVHLKKEYLDRSVNRALSKIGNLAEVDRSYIFLFTSDGLFCDNTHEWCNEGIDPQIDNLQQVPVSLIPWWMDILNKFETIHIPLVSDLPPEATSEKEILEAQGIKSLLVIPLVNSDGLIGFFGFDSVRQVKMWKHEDILLLTTLGEIIGNGFARIKYEEQLIQLNTYLEQKVEEKTKDVVNLLELNRAIVDNVELIVISTDSSGIIRSTNPFTEKILGYSFNELVGLSTPLIFHDSTDLLHKFKKHFTEEERDSYSQFELLLKIGLNENDYKDEGEWTFVSKAGNKIIVLLTVSELNNEEGETIGYVCVAIDITSKKLAEDQLRRTEAENNAIINAVPDLFFKLSREGIYLDYRNNTNQMLLVDPDLFIGNSIQNTLPADLAKKSMAALEESFNTRKIVQYDYSLMFNNKISFYENRIIAISNDEALSIIRDITERKNIEESLRTTTQNLTILIQNLQSGTLFENATRTIYMANQPFCDLFRIDMPPESLVGFDSVDILESSKHLMLESDRFIERTNHVVSVGEIIINEELYLKDGRILERDYIPVFDDNNLLVGHLWQYRDITEKKQIEKYAIVQRELGFNLAATSTLEQALNQVIQAAFGIEGINAVGIYYILPTQEDLELIVHKGFSPEFVRQVMRYNKDQFHYQIVQEGNPIYGFYNEVIPNSTLFEAENLLQIGIIPIKYEGRVIGSFNVASSSGEQFNYAAQLSLEMISAQIGGTLARIEMENELKLSQRNFQQMFETIDDFMFILNPDGQIIKTNPIVERRLGYTMEELIGMSVLQVHPPTRRDEAAIIVGEMLAGRTEVCPVPLYTRNGELIPVETKVVLGKWDGKDALYGISRDISERLKADEILRKSEARWHFALEGAGDGVWDWNLKTSEVYFSIQWKTMLGYEDSEIGNTIDDCVNLIHPDDLLKRIKELDKHFNGETKIYENEHRKRCKDGSYKWILDRGKVLEMTSDGKPLRIIGTQTDISSQKVLEEQLRKSINKEKELNDLKSRFVATTSHEFRTPLASILMISDTLLLFQHKMDGQQISQRLTKIKDHVKLLTEIVNDVLQLSKLQEGRITFNSKEEDIVLLCNNIIEGFNETVLAEDVVEFISQVDTLKVQIDGKLITQAINNLISNAIKYSNSQPKITVKLRINKAEMTISIKDKGIGIPKEDQKHLFNPFFRAGNVSTIQGNGLGLSIVQESMKMHGGNVSVESILDIGTKFTLHFPLSIINLNGS